MTPMIARRCGPLTGSIRVPGDKSISHRALLLAASAVGESRIEGLLEGDDVLATAAAVAALGAAGRPRRRGVWRVHGRGVGGLIEADRVLDMGNSGTGVRLLMGLVASHPFLSFFSGDASLSRRPMMRVTDPLSRMGAIDLGARRRPAAVGGARRRCAAADRVRAAGGLGAGQVGRAARRAEHAGTDHRDRTAADPRP